MLERAGRVLFRWRSFTPLLLLLVALPLLWNRRGPASPLWTVAGLLLCACGQALRAWVLGQVTDGTSGQNEKLIARLRESVTFPPGFDSPRVSEQKK